MLPKKKEEGEAMLQSSTENSSITAYKAEEKNRKDSKVCMKMKMEMLSINTKELYAGIVQPSVSDHSDQPAN